MIKYSFIIPVYNGEKTIKKCISSIVSLGISEIEVIVVDDGSNDKTAYIVHELKNQDHRIIYLNSHHKGVSAARNLGIKISCGKFISFVDCDDYLNVEGYRSYISCIENNDADLFCADYESFEDNDVYPVYKNYLSYGLNTNSIAFDEILSGFFNNVWSNIYKSSIIKKHKLFFDEKMRIGEDGVFNVRYLNFCESILYVDSKVYCYISNNSTSVSNKYCFDYIIDYISLFKAYQSVVDKSDHSTLTVDRRYYLSRLVKCFLVSRPAQLRRISRLLIESWFYDQIVRYKYKKVVPTICKVFIIFNVNILLWIERTYLFICRSKTNCN